MVEIQDINYSSLRRTLAALGVKMPGRARQIGDGGYAMVLATSDRRVVKVTEDDDDAKLAKVILRRKRKPRHVVHVDHVFKFSGFWVIVAERLQKMPDHVYDAWYHPRDLMDACRSGPLPSHCTYGVQYGIAQTVTLSVASRDGWEEMFDAQQQVCESLFELGCDSASDVHEENVMYRKKTREYVLVDLGYISSAKHKIEAH